MLVAASGAFLGAVRGAFRHARDAAHAALPLEAARHAARLAAKLRVPELRDAQGNAMPADVEFGFKDGRMALLQISAAPGHVRQLSLHLGCLRRRGSGVGWGDALQRQRPCAGQRHAADETRVQPPQVAHARARARVHQRGGVVGRAAA